MKNENAKAEMEEGDTEVATFPDITPSKMTSSLSHEFTATELANEKDFDQLIRLMFEFPERNFFYFQEKGAARNELLFDKENAGLILFRETEFFYYRHPRGRGFIHIGRHGGSSDNAKEKAIVEKGPMFMRTLLGLPERTRRELEIRERLTLEEEFQRRRREAETDYDVFVSYASADKDEAGQIREGIEKAGGSPFMAQKDVTPGSDFAEEIRTALQTSRELWLLVSPSSLKSDWVLSEWGAAWALQKTIVPILLRCDHEQLPDRIGRLQCIDFHKYTFADLVDSEAQPRRWSFTQVFTPAETDKLNELDKFMAWAAHRDPKQGFAYPDPKTKKMWLVYCDSYQSDDSNPTLKKRHVGLVHINDPNVNRSPDML